MMVDSPLPQAALSHCVLIHDEFCGCHTGQQQQQAGIQVTWSQETVFEDHLNIKNIDVKYV